MTSLYLSPHLDDVALSASVSVRREVSRGERVVVATFFTESRDGAARREEDHEAMRVLGATPMHLGLVDFPERRGVSPSFRALCVDRDEQAEGADLREAESALEALLASLHPSRVVLPLGIGGHVDHRIVAALAPRASHLPCAFYEDFPYAMVAPWVDGALGGPVDVAPAALHRAIEAALPGFAAAPADAADLARGLAAPRPSRLADLSADLLVPRGDELDRKLAAVACYRSQAAVALGGRSAAALYALHARSVSIPEGAERIFSRSATDSARIAR